MPKGKRRVALRQVDRRSHQGGGNAAGIDRPGWWEEPGCLARRLFLRRHQPCHKSKDRWPQAAVCMRRRRRHVALVHIRYTPPQQAPMVR